MLKKNLINKSLGKESANGSHMQLNKGKSREINRQDNNREVL